MTAAAAPPAPDSAALLALAMKRNGYLDGVRGVRARSSQVLPRCPASRRVGDRTTARIETAARAYRQAQHDMMIADGERGGPAFLLRNPDRWFAAAEWEQSRRDALDDALLAAPSDAAGDE